MLSLRDEHTNLLKSQYATWKVQPKRRPEPKPAQSQCVLFVPRPSTASSSLRQPGARSGATLPHRPGSSSSTVVLQSSSMPALRRGATTPSTPKRKATQRVDPRDAHATAAALEHPSKLLASFSTGNQCRCQLSRRLLTPDDDDDAAPTPELAELMRQCGSHFLWCPLACEDAKLRTLVKAEYERQLLSPIVRRDMPLKRR